MPTAFNKHISELIRIGKSSRVAEASHLHKEEWEACGINRQTPSFWHTHLKQMTIEEAKCLYRGLIIIERELELSGGSVAGNIWVLRWLDDRMPPTEMYELLEWTMHNRSDNSYTPFGSSVIGDAFFHKHGLEILAKCNKNFVECLFAKHSNLVDGAREKQEAKNKLISEEKACERARSSDAHELRSVQRRAYLTSEISKLKTMHIHGRLEWINKTDIPLIAVPKEYFTYELLHKVENKNINLQTALIKFRKYKGYWSKLARDIEHE